MKSAKYFVLEALMMGVYCITWGQTSTQNYIVATIPYHAVANPASLIDDNSSGKNSNSSIQYFDGLGRLSQTVQKVITPNGDDLVAGVQYDSIGRNWKNWLPGMAAGNNGAFVTDYSTKASATNVDSSPYATIEYEASPLNRTIGQYGPGTNWYSNNKKKKVEYFTNAASDVKLYAVSGNSLTCSGYYNEATLYGQKTTDEDGKFVEEFTDKQGRKVLSRVAGDHSTYYVYDSYNNLRFVLPPIAADTLTANATYSEANGTLKRYAYMYHYDEWQRCVMKKLPGCDSISMVYDLADRMVASQDGNQRIKGQWTVNKYDVFGRLLYSFIASSTRGEITGLFGGNPINETLSTSNATTGGYTFTGNVALTAMLTVNYYDNYDFLSVADNNPGGMLSSSSLSGYTDPAATSYAKTLLTGSRVYHLDNPLLFEVTALYYDKYGRIVQTRAKNHLDGYDCVYDSLDFTGKPTKMYNTHSKGTPTVQITELYRYTYDNAQRLLTTTHSLNGLTPVTIANNIYDALGRLTSKVRQNGAEAVNYSYNIRSWVTSIQKGGWKEQLFYQDDTSNSLYNGNIARSIWYYNRRPNRGYVYTYDNLNRLTHSDYGECTDLLVRQHFQDEYFTYDKMGNVMSIQRKNHGSLFDDLTLHYNGNQLLKVDDNVKTSYPSYYLTEYTNYSTTATKDFLYDANGNLTEDLDKDIVAIRYNVLNLPDTIQFRNGNQVINTYGGGGQKLRTKYYTSMTDINLPVGRVHGTYSTGSATLRLDDYFGNMLYENGTSEIDHPLTKIRMPEGYIDYTSGNRYCYYLQDHLGSIQHVTVPAESLTAIQKTQYYPSGTPYQEGEGAGVQPYKFTGKEFITMHGLNWQDYGARWLDNVRMQWTTIDPLCEKYYSISPYAYCGNNSINRKDLLGDSIYIINSSITMDKARELMYQTEKGKSLWDKYLNSKKDDIYFTMYSSDDPNLGQTIYDIKSEDMIDANNKIQIDDDDKKQEDFKSLDGLDISKSKDRRVSIIGFNEQRNKKHSDIDNAETYFHELESHVDLATGGKTPKYLKIEHRRLGVEYYWRNKILYERLLPNTPMYNYQWQLQLNYILKVAKFKAP